MRPLPTGTLFKSFLRVPFVLLATLNNFVGGAFQHLELKARCLRAAPRLPHVRSRGARGIASRCELVYLAGQGTCGSKPRAKENLVAAEPRHRLAPPRTVSHEFR